MLTPIQIIHSDQGHSNETLRRPGLLEGKGQIEYSRARALLLTKMEVGCSLLKLQMRPEVQGLTAKDQVRKKAKEIA
jgi:hypothetical protein